MYLLTKLINHMKFLCMKKMSMSLANFSYDLSVLLLSMRCMTCEWLSFLNFNETNFCVWLSFKFYSEISFTVHDWDLLFVFWITHNICDGYSVLMFEKISFVYAFVLVTKNRSLKKKERKKGRVLSSSSCRSRQIFGGLDHQFPPPPSIYWYKPCVRGI